MYMITGSYLKKIISCVLIINLLILCGCGDSGATPSTRENAETKEEYEAALYTARTTPYGKYPEQLTYTLGKLSGANNSNLPDGETYENNAYTRLLNERLNVQNQDVFEAMDEQYTDSVTMVIAQNDLPDVMIVEDLDELQYLVDNDMIADLTDSYNNCMSDTIKNIYGSYGRDILDVVTFGGKIMAIPETNISDGPNLIWLRKDWMDALGLSAPRTLSDVEEIIRQFKEKDPGHNGAGNTVGLVCDTSLCGGCGYSSEYTLDIIFAAYGAFPKQWIYDEDGNVVYGSVQPEAKEALAHIHELYKEGILDQDFLMRTSSNLIELIVDGQCGSFFGPWWAPNNPLMQAVEQNKDAEWQPYLIATEESGLTSYHTQNPSSKYIVVRKGYEYPEIACKIVSVLFDYLRYNDRDNQEIVDYYKENVDPTARPFAINVDYNNALQICYGELNHVFAGDKSADDLNVLEYSYYEACESYLKDAENASAEDWAAYASRITACKILNDGRTNKVESLYFGETETMVTDWWSLENLESDTYLKIVTGESSLDEFDRFVENWYQNGGETITKEVRAEIE
ncbi:extracellular solute-binding protein [Clostridium sp. OM05-9]|jgi:putative aldouronate transport system substrate-binding protein|nr:extracellular solute-binding protein [Clostridium sp. AF23-6LB]RGG79496.1 extracellular solute-binding protein [Clostridium sp. AF17-21AC]RHP91662.1 extracellular solute-binding protein [Clostridium sp. AM54-37XD]RHP95490.1 extracellular solute-binding protein [Clostridium sp. AM54-14XD]RHR59906.1 extracellular solute-binding protein [Clostridium sp. AF17-2]RHV14162.1 extracellular solute-binding protein [Clostridium sp. OM05-9]